MTRESPPSGQRVPRINHQRALLIGRRAQFFSLFRGVAPAPPCPRGMNNSSQICGAGPSGPWTPGDTSVRAGLSVSQRRKIFDRQVHDGPESGPGRDDERNGIDDDGGCGQVSMGPAGDL